MTRGDGAPSVAFLVTLKRREGDLIVPLREGRNLVGRGSVRSRPYWEWPKPPAVEQSQWVIHCKAGEAQGWDAGSTNLSVLLPRTLVPGVSLGDWTRGFSELFSVPGAIALPHPNVPAEKYQHPIYEGDVLRGYYASFMFGWRHVGSL
jgi:hypothetical protein